MRAQMGVGYVRMRMGGAHRRAHSISSFTFMKKIFRIFSGNNEKIDDVTGYSKDRCKEINYYAFI